MDQEISIEEAIELLESLKEVTLPKRRAAKVGASRLTSSGKRKKRKVPRKKNTKEITLSDFAIAVAKAFTKNRKTTV
jgi:hypothetical protein